MTMAGRPNSNAEKSGEGMPARAATDGRAPARSRDDGRRPRSTDSWREPAARVIGAVVSLGAFWSVLSVVFRGAWRESGEDLFGLVNLPVGPSLFSVALLVLLANALRRRLRFALWLLVVFQVLSILDGAALVGVTVTTRAGSLLGHFSVGERSDLIISVVAAVVLIPLLIALRPVFPARLYPASGRAAGLILIGGVTVSALVAIGLTWVFHGTLESPGERVLWSLRVVVGVDRGRTDAAGIVHRGPHWIAAVAGLISAVARVTAAVRSGPKTTDLSRRVAK